MPRCPTCYRRLAGGAHCPRHPDADISVPSRGSGSVPPEVPGYRVGGCIGTGGYATVWAAVRARDAAPVAIKVSHTTTTKAQRRFAGEAEALGRVGPPHVPALYACDTLADGRPYLVMERLDGASLATRLGESAAPPELAWVHEVADAVLASLHAVHQAGLVHGDLKPDNIFVSSSSRSRVRLLDFGVAREQPATAEASPEASDDHDSQDEIVGTAEYMAPEQLEGAMDHRADIYSAGILLYEFLTLRVPFVGDVASIRHGHHALRPPLPSEFAAVPKPLEELCLSCLAKSPDRRPKSAARMRELLTEAVAEGAAQGAPVADAAPARRHRGSSLLVDARQPVALLAVEVPTTRRAIEYVIERHRGVVARQRGRLYICGFSGLDDRDPVQTAMATARELVEQYSARAVLHIALLKVRRRRRGKPSRLYGPALETTRDWIPGGDWRGILMTEKLASALPAGSVRPAPDRPQYFEPAGPTASAAQDVRPSSTGSATGSAAEAPFVGREDVLARADASLREVIEHTNPGLFTVYGDSGMGKTRLARELARLAARTDAGAVVLPWRASRRELGRPAETVRRLLDVLAERTALAPIADGDSEPGTGAVLLGDALRQAARAQPLVLLIDDIQYADGAALDAIEYATLDGDGIRLWIAAMAHPHLRRRRPQWGQRAHSYQALELAPLPESASMKLAAELLRPAEYPPADTLRRLAQWAGGSPHSLAELVRTLKREGFVRQRANSESWYLATAELDRLPPSPAEQWLAARQLDALPSELAACLRLCSVLGVEFLRDELEWVQNAADRSGTASSAIDTDVGLRELEQHGFIAEQDGVWTFGQAAFQDAVYKLVGTRERKHIHGDALAFWRRQANHSASDRVLAAIARHAGASEEDSEAADAHLELGDRARRRHQDVDADQHYTAALAFIDERDHTRCIRALGGRGKVRYRVQRTRESIDDLGAAQQHAAAIGDDDILAELLLEEATALDWEWSFRESKERVDRAQPLVERSTSSRLAASYWNAMGRCWYRQGRIAEAVELLGRARDLAAACGDDETRIIALLMLATGLTYLNQLDEAALRFDEVVELCEKTGDRLHLCAAYSNKALLWLEEKSLHRGIQDLHRAVNLAREVGQPILERIATHNLAELLHRSGKTSEALSLARRAYALQRFLPEPVPPDALLLARIHAALEQFDQVRTLVQRVHELAQAHPLTDLERIAVAMLELVLCESEGRATPSAWDELLEEAGEHLPGDELLEFLYFRALMAAKAGRRSEVATVAREAHPLLDQFPVWRNLFESLANE